MYGWLNAASLALGLAAWALPGWLLARPEARRERLGRVLTASGTACGLSLLCQLAYGWHLVAVGDWTALMDTSAAVTASAGVLVAVTAALNALAAAVCGEEGRRRRKGGEAP